MDFLRVLVARVQDLIRQGLTFLRGLLDRLIALIVGPSPQQLVSPTPTASEQPPRAPIPTAAPTIPLDADGTDDETALARMLASETRSYPAKVVIGWITIQRAKKTSLYQFLTKGLGYGKQDRRDAKQGIVYASTSKPPTADDRQLARSLLSGSVVPSAAIRAHKPGAWVERGQGTSDDSIVSRQTTWKEGIYAYIDGTKWVLYSSDTKPIEVPKGKSATQILDNLVPVPGIDTDQKAVA